MQNIESAKCNRPCCTVHISDVEMTTGKYGGSVEFA